MNMDTLVRYGYLRRDKTLHYEIAPLTMTANQACKGANNYLANMDFEVLFDMKGNSIFERDIVQNCFQLFEYERDQETGDVLSKKLKTTLLFIGIAQHSIAAGRRMKIEKVLEIKKNGTFRFYTPDGYSKLKQGVKRHRVILLQSAPPVFSTNASLDKVINKWVYTKTMALIRAGYREEIYRADW